MDGNVTVIDRINNFGATVVDAAIKTNNKLKEYENKACSLIGDRMLQGYEQGKAYNNLLFDITMADSKFNCSFNGYCKGIGEVGTKACKKIWKTIMD